MSDLVDSPSRRFCRFCGAGIQQGQQYCGSCGKSASAGEAPNPEDANASRAKWVKIGWAVGIIGVVGFAALGLLTPYFEKESARIFAEKTMTAKATSNPCDDYFDWNGRHADRAYRMAEIIQAEATKTYNPDDTYADSIKAQQTVIAEAELDVPPSAAREFNSLVIELWGTLIEFERASDDRSRREDSFRLADEMDELGKQVNLAENELTDTCG